MLGNGGPAGNDKNGISQVSEKPKVPGHGDGRGKFVLNLEEALTPDPGTEDMYRVDGVNKFAFTPGQLSKLLNPKSLSAFYALGGIAGLEKGLRTDSRAGLSVDETTLDGCVTYEEAVGEDVAARVHSRGDKEAAKAEAEGRAPTGIANPHEHRKEGPFADRLRVFRENRLPDKKTRSIWELAWSTYNDKVLILLTIAAVVSLALGLYQTFGQQHDSGEARVEWVEGVAIMVAIVVVVVVGTINDWQMERQFQALNAKNEARNVKVIRSGKSQEISVYDIMVGDLVHLYPGDLVPVDGIFVQGHGVKCDESSATGESDLLRKTPAAEVFEALKKLDRDDIEKLDPFIISGSKVQEGTGTFLVTAVGVNSSYGRTTMALREEPEPTPLQRKLNVLADYIAKIGGSAALLLFVVLFIKFLVELRGSTDTPSQKGQNFLRIFIQAVTVVVVAVPEGLPLAVTLALAFATTRMLKDNNLVRVLRACETMGNATTICSDKTGTLTQNRMTVVACTIGRDRSFGGDGPELAGPNESEAGKAPAEPKVKAMQVGEFVKSLSSEVKDLVVQANAVNSTAFEGVVEDKHTFIGSKTEVALLEFCKNHLGAGPVAEERANADVVQVVPFDSAVKYMATVVRLANGKFRVYAKGASEILLDRCTRILADPSADDLGTVELAQADKDALLQIITSYASQTLRTISVSFRDFDVWPPPDAVSEEDPKLADFTKAHRDMTLLGIFGIKDPLRPGVIDAVKDCQKAGVVVRMVTGDNILTARAIATECGIYSPETHGLAMEGPVFRRLSDEELTQKVGKLQVLARSSPEDKRILVKKLKDLGETVAVTGDGTNDAPALKSADIGFSMGIAGTEVAKEASDIVLMDDNFSSIVKGIMWGRAVNDSVRKFLQFQITVNVTAVVLTFVSAVASENEESVLTAVQLLWVNLIMDTFAALALATDPPSRAVLDRKPDRKSSPLITLRMTKMILGQAIYQLAVTLVLNFAGMSILGYDPESVQARLELKTLIFNAFVWMQIFNELNNRRLDNKLNIFEGITRNWFFLIINTIMVGGQVLIIFVGGAAFKITRLDGIQWAISIVIGAVSLPVGAVIRCIPDKWVAALLPTALRETWAPETMPKTSTVSLHRLRGGRVNTFAAHINPKIEEDRKRNKLRPYSTAP